MSHSYSRRCSACTCEFDPVSGSGPEQARVMLVGERPGRDEERYRRVFVGKTGQELDETYLSLARLYRNDVRVENVVRCFALGNRAPTDKEVAACASHFLPRVLDQCKPEILVLMGGSAHKIIDAKPGERRPRVDFTHGRPLWGSVLNGTWEGWIWSSYHPALGMHDTTKMSDLLTDFENLGKWMAGTWEPPQGGLSATKDYALVDSEAALIEHLRDGMEYQRARAASDPLSSSARAPQCATDTERHGPEPWSVQYSLRPGSARLIRYVRGNAGSERLMNAFSRFLHETHAELGLHNAGQDIDMLEAMGVEVPAFRDTMQEAFQLCSLPQGLKVLAYRLLGVTMTSWEDVVWPASVDALNDWAVEAIDLCQRTESLQRVDVEQMKTWTCLECGHRAHGHKKVCGSKSGEWKGERGGCPCVQADRISNEKKIVRPGALESILNHVIGYVAKTVDADEPYDPWKALFGTRKEPGMLERGLRGNVPMREQIEFVEEAVGKIPILGIGNCELSRAITYGCGDSDMTGQVAEVLDAMRNDRCWEVQEGDYDQ